jgi:hypothetical protein
MRRQAFEYKKSPSLSLVGRGRIVAEGQGVCIGFRSTETLYID